VSAKDNPGTLAAAGAEKARVSELDPSRSKLPTDKANSFWPDVRPDPDFRRAETTRVMNGPAGQMGEPPGKGGWATVADCHDGFTIWHRKVRR
jgi:hypothetical protein